MARSCCNCARLPIVRQSENHPDGLPQLPDEIIEFIISKCLPSEIVAYGWDQVSHPLAAYIHRQLCNSTHFCALRDPLFDLYQTTSFGYDVRKFDKFFVLLIKKYLCQVESMVLPVSLFSHLQRVLNAYPFLASTSGTACQFRLPQPGVALTHLKTLTIHIGSEWGGLTLSHNFENLKTPSTLCNTLHTINLSITLSDNEDVTCAGFKELLRFLKEISCDSTMWNITLNDNTTSGQQWSGPVNLARYRNKRFITYVRAMIDLSLPINQLSLFDTRKAFPFMNLITSCRRTIYMFPEFKRCRRLVMSYDIGMIAPNISNENDKFGELTKLKVNESHVLYKSELLEYLKSAHGLLELKVLIPMAYQCKVARCKEGCISGPDFCFR
uniref:Uncharacterized protein n=1 Tax=Caenorhabditis japonica TaxID=281687 RepID=A0A8R1E0F4_CAEJA